MPRTRQMVRDRSPQQNGDSLVGSQDHRSLEGWGTGEDEVAGAILRVFPRPWGFFISIALKRGSYGVPCLRRSASRRQVASLRGSTYGAEYDSPFRSLQPCPWNGASRRALPQASRFRYENLNSKPETCSMKPGTGGLLTAFQQITNFRQQFLLVTRRRWSRWWRGRC